MRTLVRTFKNSIRALARNVTRTALTCMGIVIGIAAVIAMMEIGNGVSKLQGKSIAALGANNLNVQPGAQNFGGISQGAGSNNTLTPQDCDAILRDCPAIKVAAPTVGSNSPIVYGNKNWTPRQTTGTTPAYLEVRDWPLADGENFTDLDVRASARVCLIGQTLKHELFGLADPIGKELRLGQVSLKVLGVLGPKGANMFGQDQDDTIIAPWTTLKYRVSNQGNSGGSSSGSAASTSLNTISNVYASGQDALYPAVSASETANTPMPIRFANVGNIQAAANSAADIQPAIKQITQLLRERHHLRADEPDDFNIRDMTELSNTLGTTTRLITSLLIVVALISLVVGGVGIMNIMLVSVTERTREIGLRMAVGARSRDILFQFLIEATVLCLLGGAIGVILGRGTSLLVRWIQHWPTEISYPAIIGSVIVSSLVGVIFGFYPAWKASRLDPIEALRYE